MRNFRYNIINKKIYDSKGHLIREGDYINNYPIGLHEYFENGEIYKKAKFIVTTDERLSIIKKTSLLGDKYLQVFDTSFSYLYEDIYIANGSDTIHDKSIYTKVEISNDSIKKNDSVFISIDFHVGKYEIEGYDVFIIDPNDISTIYAIFDTGSKFNYHFKDSVPGNKSIQGSAVLHLRRTSQRDTVFFQSVAFFEKNYKVSDE